MKRWKHKPPRRQPGNIELVLVPDVTQYNPTANRRPSASDHLLAMQRRIALQGRRIVPGAPEGVRRVKIPVGYGLGGEVQWRDV